MGSRAEMCEGDVPAQRCVKGTFPRTFRRRHGAFPVHRGFQRGGEGTAIPTVRRSGSASAGPGCLRSVYNPKSRFARLKRYRWSVIIDRKRAKPAPAVTGILGAWVACIEGESPFRPTPLGRQPCRRSRRGPGAASAAHSRRAVVWSVGKRMLRIARSTSTGEMCALGSFCGLRRRIRMKALRRSRRPQAADAAHGPNTVRRAAAGRGRGQPLDTFPSHLEADRHDRAAHFGGVPVVGSNPDPAWETVLRREVML